MTDPNNVVVSLPTTKKKETRILKTLILVVLVVYSTLLLMPVWFQLGGRDASWEFIILNTAWVGSLHLLLIPPQTYGYYFSGPEGSRTSAIHRIDRLLFYIISWVVGVGMWFALMRTAAVFFADYTGSTDTIFIASTLIALACAMIHYVRTMFMGAPLLLTLVWVIFTSTTISTGDGTSSSSQQPPSSSPQPPSASSNSASASQSKLVYTVTTTSVVLLIAGAAMLYIVAKGLLRAAKQKMGNAYLTIASAYVFALVPLAFWFSGDRWLSQYAYARGTDYLKVYAVIVGFFLVKIWNYYGYERAYSSMSRDENDSFLTVVLTSWLGCCARQPQRPAAPDGQSLLAADNSDQ